jgi:hypothetical protein
MERIDTDREFSPVRIREIRGSENSNGDEIVGLVTISSEAIPSLPHASFVIDRGLTGIKQGFNSGAIPVVSRLNPCNSC